MLRCTAGPGSRKYSSVAITITVTNQLLATRAISSRSGEARQER
jgi:hypothetical protein